MWLLVTTLCLQLSTTDAQCRREVQKPVPAPMTCRERIGPQKKALIALADDLDAKVLLAGFRARSGKDRDHHSHPAPMFRRFLPCSWGVLRNAGGQGIENAQSA